MASTPSRDSTGEFSDSPVCCLVSDRKTDMETVLPSWYGVGLA